MGAWSQTRCLVLHALVALAMLPLAGCTSLVAYRGDFKPCDADAAAHAEAGRSCLVKASTEVHTRAGYALHFVEFDDQGWPFNDAQGQIDWAITRIRGALDTGGVGCVRLFVFVHGWRHNAMSDDSDVQGFRSFLSSASDDASQLAGRGGDPCQTSPADQPTSTRPKVAKTVGLFVGWRGRALLEPPIPFVNDFWAAFSFFDRKSTAERVAQGSVRELFGRLSILARYAPTDARMAAHKAPTQRPQDRAELHTFVMGHSFGASLAYRALSQTLIQAFAEDLDLKPTGRDALVAQFVDMLVLINPAIEAARFEPIFRGARKRTEADCPDPQAACAPPEYQPPVLAIFTSEGDGATRSAFPIGAFLSNFFERSETAKEGRAIRNTIGWNDDYVTHLLTQADRCGEDEAVPYGNGHATSTPPLLYRPAGWCWCFGSAEPVRIAHQAKPAGLDERSPYNGPLWNVRVDEGIIKDHSDIWNPRFRQVLLKLFAGQPAPGTAALQMPAPDSSKVSALP